MTPRQRATKPDLSDRDPTVAALGDLIYLQRHAQRLTQAALAERSGVATNHLGAIERGELNPTYGTLVRLAHGLDIPLHQLLDPDHRP